MPLLLSLGLNNLVLICLASLQCSHLKVILNFLRKLLLALRVTKLFCADNESFVIWCNA